jgi:class 3 adenylate cyclase/pimeloyl-ACP methyl ester carboxylesterase
MGTVSDGEVARTATVAVLFCDLVGSTERQVRMGDDAADVFRRAFLSALSDAVLATHGEVVKNTGDGLMVVFRDSTVDAVTCASKMHDGVEALDSHEPAFVRVGVSAGEVSSERGDWFGTPVVEAARLCAAAEAGQTLVTEVLRSLVGSRGGHQFRSVGALTLKGLAEPLATAAVIRTPIAASVKSTRSPRRPRWPSLVGIVAVVAAIAVVVFVHVSRNPRATPPPTLVDRGYQPHLEATSCSPLLRAAVPGVTCGYLSVPEDRSNPRGRWIHLLYHRYPARHPSSDLPVIDVNSEFTLPDSSSGHDADATASDPAQTRYRDDHEIITIAARGLYRSSPALSCPEFAAVTPAILTHAQNDPTIIDLGQAALRACRNRLTKAGVALDRYTFLDQANDVVDLTEALRLNRFDLEGSQDGALVALAVARARPDAVRSLYLVAPDAPSLTLLSDPTAELAAAFDRFQIQCQKDPHCRRAYPDLDRLFRADVTEANAHPQMIAANNITSIRLIGPRVSLRLDGDRLAKALYAVLAGNPEGLPLLPTGIKHPNSDLDASLALAASYPLALHDFPWGGFLSRLCSYDENTRSPGAPLSDNARPEFAGNDDPAYQWMCAAWQVAAVPSSAVQALTPDVPTMIVLAALSPDPEIQATAALRTQLSHVLVLTFDTPTLASSESNYFPACVVDLRDQFEREPTRRIDPRSCEGQSPPIKFIIGPD